MWTRTSSSHARARLAPLGPLLLPAAAQAAFECMPLRIPVASFSATASQQRARRRLGRLARGHRSSARGPRAVQLYARWHAGRERRRDGRRPRWAPRSTGSSSRPARGRARDELPPTATAWLAVSLCDVTKHLWSAIYFFYDPLLARLSPGIGNVMLSVELARQRGIPMSIWATACWAARRCATRRDSVRTSFWGRPGPTTSRTGSVPRKHDLRARPGLPAMR